MCQDRCKSDDIGVLFADRRWFETKYVRSEDVMEVENEEDCNLGVRIFLAPGPQHDFAQLHPPAPNLLLPGHRLSLHVDFSRTSVKCKFMLSELETLRRKQ
jgi:hypothetical protein